MTVGSSVGSFRSLFELLDRALGQGRITVQIARIKNDSDIAQTMASDRGDLSHGEAGKRQARHSGATQIMEGLTNDACRRAGFTPTRSKAVRSPRLLVG